MSRRVARVLLDSPLPQLDRLFDYAVPAELVDQAVPGVRVRVPLRTAGRTVDGFLVELGEEDDADRPLSDLEQVVSSVPVLPDPLYRLARAVADRAAGGCADVLRLVVPKRMVRAEKSWLARDPAPDPSAPDRTAAEQELLGIPGLLDALSTDDARLALQAPTGAREGHPAWARTLAAAAVTVFARGKSAVIAVPDHRDLDLLSATLNALGAAKAVIRVDADRTGTQRYADYLRLLEERAAIVIGNRSAVYAPVHRLGLLTVWDDGDSLFEEPLSPYVHARDAALVRQGQQGGVLLFAGHTRTTDVERLVSLSFLTALRPERPRWPQVQLSALGEGEQQGARIPSSAFRAVRTALESGPVLVQVARPGYAPTLVCASCRTPVRCADCGGSCHAPSRGAVPVCSWCGRTHRSWRCVECSGTTLRLASSGSERTADELGRAFPGARVIVADGAHPIAAVDDRPALIVATRGAEPVAFNGYHAVLLLDGDRMLQAPDLRVAESCLRWWSNAAALAAPDAPVHLVGVTGPAARALASWTQPAYAHAELAERAALRMPPAARVARIEGVPAAVDRALASLAAETGVRGESVLGPVAVERDGVALTRALARFDYARGAEVASSLRAAVVAEAMAARARPKSAGRRRPRTNTLAVRLDLTDPDL